MEQIRAFEYSHGAKGRRPYPPTRFGPVRQAIEPAVAAVFDVPLGDLRATTRGSRICATIPRSMRGSIIWSAPSARWSTHCSRGGARP